MDDTAIVVAEAAPPQESVETATEAAVEIAAIEAERDVTIAETQAETIVAVAEADASEEEIEQWLNAELAGLRERIATVEGSLLAGQMAQAQMAEQMAALTLAVTEMAERMPPLILPSPSPEEVIPEPEPEPIPEPVAGEDVPEAPAAVSERRRKRVWM